MKKRGVFLLVSIVFSLVGVIFIGQYVGYTTLKVGALFDFDDDGVLDSSDNCPLTPNADQNNSDSKGFKWVECLDGAPNRSSFGDDDNFVFILPFNFSYFGREIVAIDVDSNGEIELLEIGESCFDCSDYGTHEDGDYYDSIFALNDDLEMVEYGVCDLGDKIITQWSGYTLDDGNYSLSPLDFEVVINKNGDVRWNFLRVNWSSFNNDLYSGLGRSGGSDIDLGYEQSEAETSYLLSYDEEDINQLVSDGIGDVCEEVTKLYNKNVMMIRVGGVPYFVTLTGSGKLISGEDFNGKQVWFFESNTSGLSNVSGLGATVVKTEFIRGTNFNVTRGKDANATVDFSIAFIDAGKVYNATLDVVTQVASWPPGVLCFKYLGSQVLLGKTPNLDDISLVGFWSCLENISLPVISVSDVGTGFPNASFESFPIQGGLYVFDNNTFRDYVVTLTGDTVIGLADPNNSEIKTEIIEMSLVGSHPVLGNVSLTIPLNSSTGKIFGNNFPADSFFDINFDISLPGLTVNDLHLNESIKTFASIFNIPWTPTCHQFILDSGAELSFINDVGSNIFVKQFFWCPVELSESVSCVEQACLTNYDCRLDNQGVGLCQSSNTCVLGCVVDKTQCDNKGLDDACFGGVCESGQCSTCGTAVCEGDSTRTFSPGYGEGNGACRAFDNNQSGCESAFMLSHDGNTYFTSCWYSMVDDTCRGCGPNNEGESCDNECIPSVCKEDSSRTTFVGGPGNSACRNLNMEAECNDAFHRSGDGRIASCYWDGGSCRGCGPNNEKRGLCVNTCNPEGPVLCEDNSSLIFAGGFGQDGGSCPQFMNQSSCENHYTVSSQYGFAVSCYWNGNSCYGCGPNNEGLECINSCITPSCDGRSSFVGGPGSSPCGNNNNQTSCEDSFHRSSDGSIASCYWDGFQCSGCGPWNEQQGDCVNICRTECSSLSSSSCEEASYCDVDLTALSCNCEPGFEGGLPQETVKVITEEREGGTSVTLDHPEVDVEFIVPTGEIVNVSNVQIATSITSSSSKTVITGLSLPQGVTKSVNLPVPSGVTSLCVVDKAGEVDIETGCANGVIISCPGSVDGYSCSVNGGTVTVSGLSNTVLGTFIPVSFGRSGGSGPQGASHGIQVGDTKKVWAVVFASEQGEFIVNNSVFRKISFIANEDLYGVWFEVDDDTDAPVEFPRLVFRTIRVGGRSLGDKLNNLKIDFDVPLIWFERHSLSSNDVVLYRLVDDVWVEQSTFILSEDDVVHYSASIDGFSYFVIGQRAPDCSDDQRNGQETGIDCGGSCGVCTDGQGCLVDKDCFSFNCVNGLCRSLFSCSDGIKNQGEEEVDCGGPCPACEVRVPFSPVNYFFSVIVTVAVLGLIFFVFERVSKKR